MMLIRETLTQPAELMIIFSFNQLYYLNMSLEQQIFTLRSAIISAKRSIPLQQEPIQNNLDNKNKRNQQEQKQIQKETRRMKQQKIGRVRELLKIENSHTQTETQDYFIDLSKERVNKRPRFTPSLREMIRDLRQLNKA